MEKLEKMLSVAEMRIKALSAANESLKIQNDLLSEELNELRKENKELESEVCYLQDMLGDCEDEYDDDEEYDEEEDKKAYLDVFKNPFGLSMRDVFKMGEAAKTAMSPAELTMYDMMKKACGITDEDLK